MISSCSRGLLGIWGPLIHKIFSTCAERGLHSLETGVVEVHLLLLAGLREYVVAELLLVRLICTILFIALHPIYAGLPVRLAVALVDHKIAMLVLGIGSCRFAGSSLRGCLIRGSYARGGG